MPQVKTVPNWHASRNTRPVNLGDVYWMSDWVNEEGPVLSIQVTMAAGYTPPGNSLALLAMRKYVK